jgi:cell division protein FtsB
MTTQSSNNNLAKILIAVLVVLLLSLAGYTYTLIEQNEETVLVLEADKAEVQKELEALVVSYNEILKDNELKDKDLIAARDRILVLLDSVKGYKANLSLISRYKAQVRGLKNERTQLFKRADSLLVITQRLTVEKDSTTAVLNQTIKAVDSVTIANTQMSKSLEKGALIGITNLDATAIIVRKGGKIKQTKRSSRADKIKVCYTIAPNMLAQAGDRLFYVQVMNPDNNVIGDKSSITFGQDLLTYSKSASVFYENQALEVCAIVDGSSQELVKGLYNITVFDAGRQIGSTILVLK